MVFIFMVFDQMLIASSQTPKDYVQEMLFFISINFLRVFFHCMFFILIWSFGCHF